MKKVLTQTFEPIRIKEIHNVDLQYFAQLTQLVHEEYLDNENKPNLRTRTLEALVPILIGKDKPNIHPHIKKTVRYYLNKYDKNVNLEDPLFLNSLETDLKTKVDVGDLYYSSEGLTNAQWKDFIQEGLEESGYDTEERWEY